MLGQKQTGLTLIEWLVVIAIIAILIIIIFAHINPLRERDRASDSKRKSDLDRIRIAMEDYYGDHDCYPTPGPDGLFLCGGDTPDDFHLYLSTVPCDPDTGQGYFYQPEDTDCPSYYRMYTNLRWEDDPVISEIGCSSGCGPGEDYNYGVSSPNVSLADKQSLNTGCHGNEDCTVCVASWEDKCVCNKAGACCVEEPRDYCPKNCLRCYRAEHCFSTEDCGGYLNKDMPY